jgi:hypothetical protein
MIREKIFLPTFGFTHRMANFIQLELLPGAFIRLFPAGIRKKPSTNNCALTWEKMVSSICKNLISAKPKKVWPFNGREIRAPTSDSNHRHIFCLFLETGIV